MATKSSSRIHFEAKASRAMNGIALVFDLEGFSAFFNQPDVHNYVPRYLNHVLEAVTRCYAGGDIYWADDEWREAGGANSSKIYGGRRPLCLDSARVRRRLFSGFHNWALQQ